MERILIVDDQEDNIYLLDVLLKNSGYQVRSARNGKEAIDFAMEDTPDLIISDILMPEMDGFMLCRELKKKEPLKSVPFVFYTATYTDTKDQEFALSLGADMFLIKPMQPDVFVKQIKDVLQKFKRNPKSISKPVSRDKEETYKLYSERLIKKLETKMLQLEKLNRSYENEIAERKKVQEDLNIRLKEISSFNRFTQRMVSTLSVEKVISSALEELVGTTMTDIAMVSFIKGDELILKGVKPDPVLEQSEIEVKKVGVCLCGIAAESQHPIYSADIHKDDRCTLKECKNAGVRSFAALPISWDGKNKGILGLASMDGYDFEKNAAFIETMASVVSATLENSVLHQDLVSKTKRLSESQERLSLALDAANLGMWDFNPVSFGDVHFSDNWFKMLGYDPKEFPHTIETWNELLHPGDIDAALQRLKDHVEGRGDYSIEFRLKGKDGAYHWINSIGRIVNWDDDGNPDRMVGVHLDITERKKREEDLIRLKAAVEQAADSIEITDSNGLIQYVNPAFEKLSGFSIKDLIGKNPSILQSGYHSKEFYSELWDSISKGQVWSGKFHNRKKDGTIYIEEATISPVHDHNGKIMNFIAVKKDITEKVQLEKYMIQAQKMESIGTLAGGIAHDFNNILSSIMGFTELALNAVEDGSTIKDDLQEVYSAGKRAKDLVNQILSFARQSEEKTTPIRVDRIAREVLKFIRSSIPTTIEIKQNINSDSLIMGNSTQIHQILMNLLTNAAQAMENEGGILTLSLEDFNVDTHSLIDNIVLKSGDYLKLEISDSGIGMSPETIESIFDPYFTTKAPGEGTGMGLSLVLGIVEGYGGKITVKSELGQGAVFIIYLPVTKKHENRHAVSSERLPSGTEHVLFIDDEAPIIKMGKRILNGLGYTVTTNTSSVEALELFRSNPNDFDLIITDLTMPNITGDKLAVELIKIRSDIPVILCTGYSKKMSDEAAEKIGIKAFAYKPVEASDLAKTVREVLDEAKS